MESQSSKLWHGLTMPELIAGFCAEGWIADRDEWDIVYYVEGGQSVFCRAVLACRDKAKGWQGEHVFPWLKATWEAHPVAFILAGGEVVSPDELVSFSPVLVQTSTPGRVGNL